MSQLMGKLLDFFDKYALKFCVSFLIFFIALYPKLPSVHINHTWVYIRLEDFAIALTVLVWLITLYRRKARIPAWLGAPFAAYWIFGLVSLIYSIIFIGPLLLNYFPHIAALSYLRRVEYMILFFVAFTSVRNIKDAKDYLKVLVITSVLFTLYGFGQRFYIYLYDAFPKFFIKFPFCFPSFQTGNEEFAKGIPLCLPFDGRITSTFAGHYDLSAYLVMVIPIFIAIIFTLKKRLHKILFSLFTLSTIIILILTSSRISFPSYLIGSAITLILIHKKKFIIPLIIVSIVLLPLFSSSMAKRFLQTFRLTKIVIDSQGHIIGEQLSPELQRLLAQKYLGNIPTQDLPAGSGFIGLPDTVREKTDTAIVRSALTAEEAKKLKLENGGVELTAVKGNFTLKRALVYDISLTTRLQAEWPNAIHAFSRNFLIGSGFSTITLATDNDYLRFLGETGVLGLFSFLFIFLILFIVFRKIFKQVKDPTIYAFGAGIAGGIAGLFLNATLFDIFEASKVAETMWILLGVSAASFLLIGKKIDYLKELKSILLSHVFIIFYLALISLVIFLPSINNFFVADDFTWLKWAASSSSNDLLRAFTDASGFFYRPISKDVMFILYALFAFKPAGYHVFILILHVITTVGVYFLTLKLFKRKIISFISSILFLILPIHAENLYWISTLSINLSALFVTYGLLCFHFVKEKKSIFAYILSLIFFAIALFNYEGAIVFTGLILLIDFMFFRLKRNFRSLIYYIPYLLLSGLYLFVRANSNAIGPSGDYSYNLVHFVPNFIGNFLGYLFSSVFGEFVLPYYLKLRLFFREELVLSAVLILVIAGCFSVVVYLKRKLIEKLIKDNSVKNISFGLLFFGIALLPFLGLGNIAGRYVYLSTVGFVMSFALFIDLIIVRYGKRTLGYKKLALVLVLLIGAFYFKELNHSNNEWQNAGKITNRTLSYLKLYHEEIPSNSNLLFINTPIRKEDAWIFPVGLPDGIWFIYNDDSLNVQNINTLGDARKIKRSNPNKTFIFEFQNFVMEEVK